VGITKRWRTGGVVLGTALITATGLMLTVPAGAAPADVPAGTPQVTQHGTMPAGKVVHASTSTKPFQPNAAQRANQRRVLNLPAAPIGPHPQKADIAKLNGPQTDPSKQAQLPGDLTFFKKTTPNAACASSCAQSTINEPDTVGIGKTLFQTSNWDIAYTTNGGAATPTWLYQNPYALNPQFCCDQTVTYDAARNIIVRQSLDLGTGTQTGFDIAIAKPQTPTTWCTYHFSGPSFGGASGELLDYPKTAIANNNLYVTWNAYNASGSAWLRTGLARLPLDNLKACSGFSFNFLSRTDNFTFGLSYGESSLDTFYWVSNWYTTSAGSGTSERIFYWPENSGTYFLVDRAVAAYNFSGGSCASQDGVVTNWCSRLDPRWETASITRSPYEANAGNAGFAGDDTLTVAITAGPGGGDPFPYVIYEYFKLYGLSYISTARTFNNGFAFAYGGCSPNSFGDLGCAATYGGGTGTSHFFPAGITIIQDEISPNQPWAFSFNQTGAGNASGWGDYEITQPYNPSFGAWITTEWFVNGSGTVRPQVLIFGRGRVAGGYGKWLNS
jgi:hypothetical protein